MSDLQQDLQLSDEDIRLLVRHPDPALRASIAQRICRNIRESSRKAPLSEYDRRRAHKVLAYIVKDVAAIVRRALAVTLKNSPELPHDIAVALIRDIDTIAVPILESSPVLTDDDLLEVLKSKAAAKVLAVAKRPTISGSLVRAIIRFGDSHAVAGIAANDRVVLDEAAYNEMLDLYASDDLIQESLISRKDLPPLVVERLLSTASEELALTITSRHNVPVDMAVELATRTRERALIDFVDQSWVSNDLEALAGRLHAEGRLQPSLVLRAAACGQMRFTEYALAAMAGITHAKAALMIHESGAFGLQALGKSAGLSIEVIHILRGAVAIFRDLELAGLDYDRAYFQRLMIERVLSLSVTFNDEVAAYLMEKLDYLSTDIATPING